MVTYRAVFADRGCLAFLFQEKGNQMDKKMDRLFDFLELKEDGSIDPDQFQFQGVKPIKAFADALDHSHEFECEDDFYSFYRLLLIEKVKELDVVLTKLVDKSREIQRAAIIADRKREAV